MSLSASAIINGLTMLRAYLGDVVVEFGGDETMVVRWPLDMAQMPAADAERMVHEGWVWKAVPSAWEIDGA